MCVYVCNVRVYMSLVCGASGVCAALVQYVRARNSTPRSLPSQQQQQKKLFDLTNQIDVLGGKQTTNKQTNKQTSAARRELHVAVHTHRHERRHISTPTPTGPLPAERSLPGQLAVITPVYPDLPPPLQPPSCPISEQEDAYLQSVQALGLSTIPPAR